VAMAKKMEQRARKTIRNEEPLAEQVTQQK
jgi:hypothetical protein